MASGQSLGANAIGVVSGTFMATGKGNTPYDGADGVVDALFPYE